MADDIAQWLEGLGLDQYAQAADAKRTGLARGHAAANGAMRLVRLLHNFAKGRVPNLSENPVRQLSRDRAWFPEQRRTSVVMASELPSFYEALHGLKNPVARDYLLVVLLTGLRRNEAASLLWSDIDLIEKMIRLPADRTKSNRKLDIPMSDWLADIFTARRAAGTAGPWVFPAHSRSGHYEEPRFALSAIAEATGIKVTVHDLRRTFITIAESCDIPVYALKGMVNHSLGNDVTAGYISANPERLREPMQKVTNKIREHIGIHETNEENIIKLNT